MKGIRQEKHLGILYAVLAFTAWGLLPLYWNLLKQVPPIEILAHRIFWSFVFVSVILLATTKWNILKEIFTDKRKLVLIFLCSIIISINWFTYIFAVSTKQVVEASMGYYINPLVVVFLGMTVLKERLNYGQYLALILATIGVILMTINYGKIPWIALILAFSFALYGLFKKILNVDSLSGLALETAVLMPFALAFIIFRQIEGTGSLGKIPFLTMLILFGAGIATATPLIWFANGTKRVQLSTIGFLQYIAPSLSLFLGIFFFKEQFTKIHLISFSFIWAALLIYSFSQVSFFKLYTFNLFFKEGVINKTTEK